MKLRRHFSTYINSWKPRRRRSRPKQKTESRRSAAYAPESPPAPPAPPYPTGIRSKEDDAMQLGPTLIGLASPSPSRSPSRGSVHSPLPAHVVHSAGASLWSVAVPTWISAMATVGLFGGAVFTSIYAFRAFRKQSKEVALLQEQADLDILQRRRAQAALIF